jgi:hypothetical protein
MAQRLFRQRHYRVVPGKIDRFNRFFHDWLLPIQQRHGAIPIGRWQTEDGAEVIALWAYAGRARYRAIEAAVRADPASRAAQEHRQRHLEPLLLNTEQRFLTSTVPLGLTALAHLNGNRAEREAMSASEDNDGRSR